jgi:type IV secretion system protein VirD4
MELLLGRHESGHYITLPGKEPVVVHARTGAGKSADFGIPNLYQWPGSAVVLDVKGDYFEATSGYRAEMGQQIYVVAPGWRHSHCWDPLASIKRNSIDRFQQVANVGNILFPEIHQMGSGSNNSKFWDDVGRQAFKGITLLLAEASGERLSMERITRLFMRADGHEFLSYAVEGRRAGNKPFSQDVVDNISDYVGGDATGKLRNEIRKTVSTALQIWTLPHIAALTSRSDFHLQDLRRKPMTVYVICSPNDINWAKPFLRLFFDQLINLNTDVTPRQDPSIKYPVLVMLDEFARLGRIDSLAHAAQYVRDYWLRMVYIVQNKAQLTNIYGREGVADIFGNLGAEVVFGTNDQQVVKELEQRLGDNTVSYTTQNRPRFWPWANWAKQHESDHLAARPLMLDQEIAMMSPREQLILRSGMPPVRSGRARWFEDREFYSRKLPPIAIPRLDISIAYDDGRTQVRAPKPGPELSRRLPQRPRS